MTEEERELMKRSYGITTEEKTFYYYLGFRYDHLKDALNHAGTDQERPETVGEPRD
jgi:hypothetical protein